MTQLQAPPPQTAAGGAKLVLVAVALALTAVVLNSLYIQSIRRQEQESYFRAYVATRTIMPGIELRANDYKEIRLPKRFEQTFKDIGFLGEEEVTNYTAGKKRVTRQIAENEPLSFRHFLAVESDASAMQIEPGYRYVSVPVNSRTLPGTLRKGNWVDLEAPFQTPQGVEILPVMECVPVVALGTQTIFDENPGGRERPQSSYQTITIQVSAADATTLANVVRNVQGNFEVQLRNPDDRARTKFDQDYTINPEVTKLLRIAQTQPRRR